MAEYTCSELDAEIEDVSFELGYAEDDAAYSDGDIDELNEYLNSLHRDRDARREWTQEERDEFDALVRRRRVQRELLKQRYGTERPKNIRDYWLAPINRTGRRKGEGTMAELKEPRRLREVRPRVCATCAYLVIGDGWVECERPNGPSFDTGDMSHWQTVCDLYVNEYDRRAPPRVWKPDGDGEN